MNDTYKLRTVGGALVVTIPQQIAKALRLKSGDDLWITTTERSVLLTKAAKPRERKR